MMPSAEEIRRSLTGAALLARRDPAAMSWFDLSVDGFWRSFAAILIAFPVYAVLLAERYRASGLPVSLPLVLVIETIGYVLSWIAFPVAAIFLTRLLGLSHRYIHLVVATNWAAVLQVSLFFLALLIGSLLPLPISSPLILTVTIAVLAYHWRVVQTALDTTGGTAAALVLIDILLGSLIDAAAEVVLKGLARTPL